MFKLAKFALLAFALALVGCAAPQASHEEKLKIMTIKRSENLHKHVTEGRIVSTRIALPPAPPTVTDSVALATKSSVLGGAALVLGAMDTARNLRDAFYITYTEPGSDVKKETFVRFVPSRPDAYAPGKLFRHFVLKDTSEFLRWYDTEEAFQEFNQ